MSRRQELLAKMDDWVEGRASWWNTYALDHEHGPERCAMADAMEVVKLAAAANAYPQTRTVDVVFDGPPDAVPGRFVEVESPSGVSIKAGEWIDRGNGFWALRLEVLADD